VPDNWVLGQTVEFAVTLNARGHPQARNIDWDPLQPQALAEADGTSDVQPRTAGTDACEKLQKLLTNLYSGHYDSAVLSALSWQTLRTERDVDFVTYVLDRVSSVDEVNASLKDFTKMLLLLMLTKMMKMQGSRQQCHQQVLWFESLAASINVELESVAKNLPDVVQQIQNNLLDENVLKTDETLRSRFTTAVECLQAKVQRKL